MSLQTFLRPFAILLVCSTGLYGQQNPPGVEIAEEGTMSEPMSVEIPGPTPPVHPAVVNQAGEAGVTVRAVRVKEPMETDGVLDETFYRETEAISEFIQSIPDAGAEPSERTEVWLGFDDDNVYVGARIWDSEGPDAPIANEMRRDSRQIRNNDTFGVFFDTFFDRRNGIGFYTNRLGALTDYQIRGEGGPQP